MPLPSFLKPKAKKPAERRAARPAPPDDGGPVEQARTRARRRLMGAVVLLAAGVIGFPLVFETQPRPVALDIPIEAPHRDASGPATPLPQPVPSTAPRPTRAPPQPVTERPADAAPEPGAASSLPPLPDEARAKATTAPSAPTVATGPATPGAAKPSAPGPAPRPAPAPAPAPTPAPAVAAAADSARAKALLENAAPAASKAARFVVQVGAYSDVAALREVRQKVEKLGLKTYTQVVETPAGKRTRVRVGPFATHEEASATAARLKAAGLPAAILAL